MSQGRHFVFTHISCKMDITLTLTNVLYVVIAVLLPLLLWKSGRKQFERLPPGPAPKPLLGNLLQFDVKEPYKSYLKVSIQNTIILLISSCLCLDGCCQDLHGCTKTVFLTRPKRVKCTEYTTKEIIPLLSHHELPFP